MRRLGLFAVAALTAACLPRPAFAEEGAAAPRPEPKLEFLYVELAGVEGAEVAAVARAVGAVEGVRSFAWTVPAAEVKVVREVGKASDDALFQAARSAGAATAGSVPVAAATFTFEKKLHCGGCVGAVKRALLMVKGVKEATVPAAMTDVTAVYDTRAVKTSDIEAALAAIGKPARASAR